MNPVMWNRFFSLFFALLLLNGALGFRFRDKDYDEGCRGSDRLGNCGWDREGGCRWDEEGRRSHVHGHHHHRHNGTSLALNESSIAAPVENGTNAPSGISFIHITLIKRKPRLLQTDPSPPNTVLSTSVEILCNPQ